MDTIIIATATIIITFLTAVVSYGLSVAKCGDSITRLEIRLAHNELDIKVLRSQLKQERLLNERITARMLQLEFEANNLQSQLAIVNEENKELKQLISHGGRVIRQAITGNDNSKGMNSFINSDSVKRFLNVIKKLGLDND